MNLEKFLEKIKKERSRYDLLESAEVFSLFKAIYYGVKVYYSELLEITGKTKSTLSDQLRPLKESGLIKRFFDKEKKDYYFEVDELKYIKFIYGFDDEKANKLLKTRMMNDHLNNRYLDSILYFSPNFKHYLGITASVGMPKLKTKDDLKILFPKNVIKENI